MGAALSPSVSPSSIARSARAWSRASLRSSASMPARGRGRGRGGEGDGGCKRERGGGGEVGKRGGGSCAPSLVYFNMFRRVLKAMRLFNFTVSKV